MAVPNYGRKFWSVALNGVELEGLIAAADAVAFPTREQSVVEHSADGKMVAASTGMLGGPVSLKFIAGSQGDRFLSGLSAQFDAGEVDLDLNLTCRNNVVGELTQCTNGVFTSSPTAVNVGGGGTPTQMEYIITFEVISRTI